MAANEKNQKAANRTWIFLGPEIGEKQTAINEIKERISGEGLLEETAYYAGEIPVSQIVSNMLNGSLFAEKRLFTIKSIEGIKKKDELDLLASYIKSPGDDTYLILTSDETNVSRVLEKDILPSNKKIFWELLDSRKTQWVNSFFRQEGFRISPDAVDTILELVENNTAALKQECSRLILFLDKEKEISAGDVDKWLSHTREETAFNLFSRIAAGDLSRSIETARMLFAAKEPAPRLFSTLHSSFRKLLNYLALKEAGVTDDFEYKKIGISAPGAKRDYGALGQRYNTAAAEKCLALTTEYDYLLRAAGSFPHEIIMDRYLYKIHSFANKAAV